MDVTTLRLLDGHLPRGSTVEVPGMFERDDLFINERLRDLRAAARSARRLTGSDAAGSDFDAGLIRSGAGLIDRARRSIGSSLISIGAAVAGFGDVARNDDEPCDDCEVGAAA